MRLDFINAVRVLLYDTDSITICLLLNNYIPVLLVIRNLSFLFIHHFLLIHELDSQPISMIVHIGTPLFV